MTAIIDKITFYIAALGGVATVLAFAVGGVRVGLGAFVGAGVALANWAFLRWLMHRMADQGTSHRQRWMLLLTAKMIAMMMACWVLITGLGINPMGFVIGLSSLVLGVVVGALVHRTMATDDSSLSEGSSANSEDS